MMVERTLGTSSWRLPKTLSFVWVGLIQEGVESCWGVYEFLLDISQSMSTLNQLIRLLVHTSLPQPMKHRGKAILVSKSRLK